MTPCEELGYKVGDTFEVIDSGSYSGSINIGDIITLHADDGTATPLFTTEKEELFWVGLSQVKSLNSTKLLTGGSSDYYKLHIANPANLPTSYSCECQDIIEALKLDFNEGNIFKALWRRAAARLGNGKPGFEDGVYDAEKIKFSADRILAVAKKEKESGKEDNRANSN